MGFTQFLKRNFHAIVVSGLSACAVSAGYGMGYVMTEFPKAIAQAVAIFPCMFLDCENFDVSSSYLESDQIYPTSHNYVGVEHCGNSRCHGSERLGNQFESWEQSAHARAYETLGGIEAQAMAAEIGIDNPQQSGKCLPCHTTAYDVADIFLEHGFDRTMGVQCESCHGPGEDYSPEWMMNNQNRAIAYGLNVLDETVCRTCHNELGHNNQIFNFEEFVSKIEH